MINMALYNFIYALSEIAFNTQIHENKDPIIEIGGDRKFSAIIVFFFRLSRIFILFFFSRFFKYKNEN